MKLFRELRLVVVVFALLFSEGFAQYGFTTGSVFARISKSNFLEDIDENKVLPIRLRDIGISIKTEAEYGVKTGGFIQSLSIMKRFGPSYLRLRYSPGFLQAFNFRRDEGFSGSDSSDISLNTSLEYQEISALSYGYNAHPGFSIGLSVHQFSQNLKRDNFGAVIKSDTVYLVRESKEESARNFRFDLAMQYSISERLNVTGGVYGLTTLSNGNFSDEYNDLQFSFKRRPFISADYSTGFFTAQMYAETKGFYQFSAGTLFPLLGGYAGIGLAATTEKGNKTFVRSFTPVISFASGFWQVSLSATTFYPVPNTMVPYSMLIENPIVNLAHNKFSFNRVELNVQSAITLGRERRVVITEAVMNGPVFPALHDQFTTVPLARVKVANISGAGVTVKPVIHFPRFSGEKVHQPFVSISAGDTVEIPLYYSLPDSVTGKNSTIANITVSVLTDADDADDEVTKPVLVYGINAWDGNPDHLKYYALRDLAYCSGIAREQLSAAKNTMNMVPAVMVQFAALKVLFNNTLARMQYVADPRASSETVQFPGETLKLRGGDCDDLSVCLASLLESAGIDCAFVAYHNSNGEGHINLLVNTGVPAEQAFMLTENDNFYVIRKNSSGKDEVWVPVETTKLTSFEDAWESAALRFKKEALDDFGLAKRTVEIFEIF